MALISDVYGGNFLSSAVLKSEKLIGKLLTIDKAEVEEIGNPPKTKVILTFKETEKRLPLNKTNSRIIADSFGEETDQWIGRKIKLQTTKRQFQGNIVDAIEAITME